MPRTKKVKEISKEDVSSLIEDVVKGSKPEFPIQCLRCGGRAHEPNNECDAMK